MEFLNKMDNNIFTYKITFKQQFLMLIPLIVINATIVTGLLYLGATGTLFLGTLIGVFIINVLPVIIVHTQYYLANRGANLIIDLNKRVLIYSTKTQRYKYSFGDIKILDHHVSYGGGSGWYTFGEYRYYRVIYIAE